MSEVFADNPLQDINLYNERYFGTVVSSTYFGKSGEGSRNNENCLVESFCFCHLQGATKKFVSFEQLTCHGVMPVWDN